MTTKRQAAQCIHPTGEFKGETVYSLICKSVAMQEVARRMERAADADSPVLIWGEEGTGKKLVAETIHRNSRRGHKPLVMIDAEESSNETLNEECFGSADDEGKMAAAAGSTLLIDEITGLPRTAQARLLAAAERRHSSALTDSGEHTVDFRLMATTRHDLSQSMGCGVVREDLLYRLTVITIRLPALRHRREDIPHLVYELLAERCAHHHNPVPAVEPELMEYLVDHPWPGNVSQLRACLDTMTAAQDVSILKFDHLRTLLPELGQPPKDFSSPERIATLPDLERAAVIRALKLHNGNRTRAAKALSISVRTLQRKLKHWGM